MNPATSQAPADIRRLLERNLAAVRSEIDAAGARSGRKPGQVDLLPVVKYVGPPVVRLLYEAGVRDVAEGTVQEALRKRDALSDLPGLAWHLVGHLQRNKARRAAGLFASVHSLDSVRLARKLEEGLSEPAEHPESAGGFCRRVFLEVNIGRDPAKGGVAPEAVEATLLEIRACPLVRERLHGLMAMAPAASDPEESRPHFKSLRELRDRLVSRGLLPPSAGLSMGMSGDFAVAVEEGATVVRVGSRLFVDLPPTLFTGPR